MNRRHLVRTRPSDRHRRIADREQVRQRDRRIDGVQPIERVDVERGHNRALRSEVGLYEAGDGLRDQVIGVVVRVARQVLDLDVHTHAVTLLERFGEAWDEFGQLVDRQFCKHPAIGKLGVMVHDDHPIGGATGVKLDPFGAELTGEPERRKGVLLGSFTGATMGDHGGGRCHSHSLPPLRTTCGHKYEFLYFTFEKQAGWPSCPLKKKNRFQLFLAQRQNPFLVSGPTETSLGSP